MGLMQRLVDMFSNDRTSNLLPPNAADTPSPGAERNQRIARYRRNWQIYRGLTLNAKQNEDGTQTTAINYLKHNIDKVNYFAVGSDYTITHPKYSEYLKAADNCWGSNKVQKLLRTLQFGSICGDAYLMVAPTQVADAIVKYNASLADYETKIPSLVKVVALNPEYCNPYYDPFDMDTLLAMEIIIPIRVTAGSVGRAEWETQYQYMLITKEEVTSYLMDNGGKEVEGSRKTVPNPIKQVYAIHIRNYPLGDAVFGDDDVTAPERLHDAYNEATNNIGQILDYHADPITLIFGQKVGNLKKGPNKIWGNLPKDGKVENLEMKGDLTASTAFKDAVKSDLHALMGVPEIAQGTKQSISNTSGVALHTMYLPLIEKATTKHVNYSPAFLEVAILCLRWLDYLGMLLPVDENGDQESDGRKKMKSLTDVDYLNIRLNSVVKYELPLPKDRLIEVQIQQAKLAAGLTTRVEAITELGHRNPEVLAKQIEEELESNAERAMVQNVALQKGVAEAKAGVESGAGAETGTHKTETEEQQGRPRSAEQE
jgi:hypothetical protein